MKKTITLLSIVLIAFSLVKCQDDAPEHQNTIPGQAVSQDEAFRIIEQNCISCHAPRGTQPRVAPPLAAMKMHYMEGDPTEAEFVAAIVKFVQNPNKEDAKMIHAVEKFGLMPVMNFSPDQVSAVASYLYNTKVEDEAWFEQHIKEEHARMENDTTSIPPIKRGKEYAMATKSVLGKNLLAAIKEKGSAGAVDFCNTKAIPLTDSMQTELGVSIKRVSDLNRNPNNVANAEELAYINDCKARLSEGEELTPLLNEQGDEYVGYYPILTNDMCMQCHGTPGDQINEETLASIQEKYPNDHATGYGINELRGIWVVQFPR